MEDSRVKRIAAGFMPLLEKILKQRGVDRSKRKEELVETLTNILQHMKDECDYRLEDFEVRHDRVQNNFLDCNEREVGLRTQNEEMRADNEDLLRQIQDLERQVQWKNDELFRLIEQNSELKQLNDSLKITEELYDNLDDKPTTIP